MFTTPSFMMPPPSPENAKSVLLVDDDRLWLNVLERRLVREGFRVSTATSATGALRAIREAAVDLIVADLRMPRMDGLELRDQIASEPASASIPFVFLSGSLEEPERQAGRKLGVQHFLDKTGSLEELAALARSLTAS